MIVMLATLSNNWCLFLSDANIGLASFTILVYKTINYNNRIDHFTKNDGDRTNSFETIYDNNFYFQPFQKLSCEKLYHGMLNMKKLIQRMFFVPKIEIQFQRQFPSNTIFSPQFQTRIGIEGQVKNKWGSISWARCQSYKSHITVKLQKMTFLL